MKKVIGCEVTYFYNKNRQYMRPFYFIPMSSTDNQEGDEMYKSIKFWRSKSPRYTVIQKSIYGV